MQAKRIKIDYLFNSIGIDNLNPKILWNCDGGLRQTAYQLRIIGDDNKEYLNTEKINSHQMYHIYDGEALNYKTRYTCFIKLWDEEDKEGEEVSAYFETGLKEFEAKWITGNYRVNRKTRYPVDYFKKEFNTNDIKKARLYITACGVYEASINGKRAGDFVLAPGITDYRKRIQYQTIDVTDLLVEGTNTLNIELADGWYRGSCGAWGILNQYGTETKLLAELHITKSDGSIQKILSDDSFDWSNDGPLTFADNQDGEKCDSNKTPSYSKKAKVTKCSIKPCCSNNVPLIEHERLKAEIIKTPGGKTVLDFKQNIAGYLEFDIKTSKNQKVYLRFGELLDENGEFTQKNIQCSSKKKTTPLQEISYICKEGINHYKTKFAIFGFQFVLIESDIEINPDDFTAIAVYSDLERTGYFKSSNELLNKFVENTVWSAKNNHADLPTDCPTRERHGWSGDAQIFCKSASFLFDYCAFANKYERDLVDNRRSDGRFRQIVPVGGTDFYMQAMDGSAGWSDAGVFIPYIIYKQYGDLSILEKNYNAMKKYTDFKISTLGKHYLTGLPTGIDRKYRKYISNYGQSYGEWAEPIDVRAFSVSDFINPHPEETTAYIVFLLERMAEICVILNHKKEADEYIKISKKVISGYQALMRSEKHSLDTDRQAKLVRPLYLNLLDEEQSEYAKKRLIEALDKYKWRLGTGFLSTPLILYVLDKINLEYAYRLLENEEIPGWLSMPKNGATTIWESWEGPNAQGGVASLNHYSKGALVEWLFSRMCGINVEADNHFYIEPLPGGNFTYASCSYMSVYGEVKSSFKKIDNTYEIEISVPVNCTAKVVIGGKTYLQETGTKKYMVNNNG